MTEFRDQIVIGGYPLRDEDGNIIGHHTSWGEDIYLTKEARDALQKQKTGKVDVGEQAPTSEEVDG